MERLRSDVEALAAMTRDSAGPGERASARWVAERLRETGAQDVRIEPYRGRSTYGWAWLGYLAAGVLGPRAAVAVALVALELDGSGRRQLIRAPAGEGANVVARVPASGEARRTVVLVAHHDAAHTGLMWHPAFASLRRPHGRRQEGFAWPLALALLLRLAGLRRAALALALPLGVLLADVARGATVPGANDNATGVAGLLALATELAAQPLSDTDVLLVSTGSEESGMDGMRAFLAAHPLDPASTLVISFDSLGSGRPIVLEGEGVLLTHRYPDLLEDVERWRMGGWTDPILAVFAGIPAISILSFTEQGGISNYHLPSDLPENVDYDCVARCVGLARLALSAR
jgi:hypothetical protein